MEANSLRERGEKDYFMEGTSHGFSLDTLRCEHVGVPWRLSRVRVWHCHCYGSCWCYGVGSITGPRTSIWSEHSQKKRTYEINHCHREVTNRYTDFWTGFFCSFFFCFVLFFCYFRASPTAYGGSQARGLIRDIAASLRHSHSNVGSEPQLWPTPQLIATPDP